MPGTYENLKTISAVAGANLTGHLYKFLKLSSGRVVLNDVAQGQVFGILAEEVDAAGKVCPVVVADGGIALVKCGATPIAADALIASDATGTAIAAGTTAGDTAVGQAMEAAAAGAIFRFQFIHKRTAAGS